MGYWWWIWVVQQRDRAPREIEANLGRDDLLLFCGALLVGILVAGAFPVARFFLQSKMRT